MLTRTKDIERIAVMAAIVSVLLLASFAMVSSDDESSADSEFISGSDLLIYLGTNNNTLSKNVTLTTGFTLSDTLTIANGVTLDGGNKTITRDPNLTGNMITVASGLKVKIENLTIDGNNISDVSSAISVSGELILNAVDIKKNLVAGNGGGISVNTDAKLTINGGTISYNQAHKVKTDNKTGTGGGIYVATNGELYFNSGSITNNEANNGGGVRLYSDCTFEMGSSATITENTASNNGGGISVRDTTKVKIQGTVNGNTDSSSSDIGSGNVNAPDIHIFNAVKNKNSSVTISSGGIVGTVFASGEASVNGGVGVVLDGGTVTHVHYNNNNGDTNSSYVKITNNNNNGSVTLYRYESNELKQKTSAPLSVQTETTIRNHDVINFTYSIIYKDSGNADFSGTHGASYPTQHTYGTETDLVDASKDGSTFDGWFSASDCSGTKLTKLAANGYTANITLYAKWVASGGSGGGPFVSVTGVTLASSSLSLAVGENSTLVATVSPNNASNQSISWSSSDESVVTIMGGVVHAVSMGRAVVTVQTQDQSYRATCEVTVGKATPIIVTAPTASEIIFGQSLTSSSLSGGTASVEGVFEWADPSAVPSVSGTFRVIFYPDDTDNYDSTWCDVQVNIVNADQSVSIVGGVDSPVVGTSFNLFVTGIEESAGVTWSISSGGVNATITDAGVVTVSGIGQFTVRADIAETTNYNGTFVEWQTTSVKFSQKELTIGGVPEYVDVGDSFRLTATGGTLSGVQWSILQGFEYASIDQDGNVIIAGEGAFTVNALIPGDSSYEDAVASVIVVVGNTPYPAPAIPMVESIGFDTVVLVYTAGYEYSMDGVNWQVSSEFADLEVGNEYSFYQRVAADGIRLQSEPSEPLVVSTRGDYTVTIATDGNGTADPTGTVLVAFGDSITINVTPYEGYDIGSIIVGDTIYEGQESVSFIPVDDTDVYVSFAQYHTITARASDDCTISPSGVTLVRDGDDVTYTFADGEVYTISDIIIDGTSVGVVESYTFEDVSSDHTIYLSAISAVCTIDVSSSDGGSFDREGQVLVRIGSDQTFTATPDNGFTVTSIIADGVEVSGPSITFTEVSGDHTLYVSFGGIDTENLSVLKTNQTNVSIMIDNISLEGGTVSIPNGKTSLVSITPQRDYMIQRVTVNGQDIQLDENAMISGTTLDLILTEDTEVLVDVVYCYMERTTSASDNVVISGDQIRYDSTFTATRLTPDSVNWGTEVDNDSSIAYYIEAFSNSGDSYAFHGQLAVTIFVGTEYNGNTVTVMHKSSVTGLVEDFSAEVVEGYVTVYVSDLSPFMVEYPDIVNILPYMFILIVMLTLAVCVIGLVYKGRKQENKGFYHV